jgi:DNA-binding MarR family transcriptional regulator
MNLKQLDRNIENIKKLTPDVYNKSMQISLPLFVLHKKLYDRGEALLAQEYDLNQSELDIMGALYYMTDGTFTMSPTQLYDVMLFSSGGMTKVLKKLESKGLIVRVDNEHDKRSKLVSLSDKGKGVTVKAIKEIVSFEDEYFSKLSKEEQLDLKRLLYKILD